ncbi:protein of unknown function [Georgfuchsia toluolica]|uniref:Uncharacterized protein n=1 Tax=Georgfuchsia toluolica TaxID=424218 RepID=A0A916NGJ3_9PROT|nr:hypothetical protein [Georgfuchsia toluolica]CAG4882262.1 protein of unknown function [Georgfuchsia toluolica]
MKRLFFCCLFGIVIATPYGIAFGNEADCSIARDPRRCAALQAAREACSSLQGQARGACLREAMPPPDCSHAPNAIQCETRQAAEQACKDKRGKAHRQCLRGFKS